MWWLKCKHPIGSLNVDKAETREVADKDFDVVTYHLRCRKCGEAIQMKYAAMRGGIAAFLEGGK